MSINRSISIKYKYSDKSKYKYNPREARVILEGRRLGGEVQVPSPKEMFKRILFSSI